MRREQHTRVMVFVLSLITIFPYTASVLSTPLMHEKSRKIINDRQDKMHLRAKREFVVDCSEKMLLPRTGNVSASDFTIARKPPVVKMMIIPDMEPAYFPEDQREHAQWANWNKPTRTEDNRYIFSAGNSCTRGGKVFLYEYNPATETVQKILDVSKLLGWSDSSHTDGKIHGHMGIMKDGTLWAATKYGALPSQPWFDGENKGAWLFSYNIRSGEAKNWGVPLPENTLAETVLDPKSGKLFATGEYPSVLCWDVIKHRTVYADVPPNGWLWANRTALFDEKTGKFWGTDRSDSSYFFMSFDPQKNRFGRSTITVPENPFTKKKVSLRAITEKRAIDGAYYGITYNGAMFKFFPEKPSVESVGVNWDHGRYTSSIAIDPTGRYLYYMPGDQRMYNADTYGPIIQYDVKTGKKKVLAWLVDYYYEKYGYWVGGTYGLETSSDGSSLVIIMNGAFRMRDDLHDNPYEYPAVFIVDIPSEER